MKTLFAGGIVVTCDDVHTIFHPGDVVIDDEVISYVGAKYDGEYDVRHSVTGTIVMPGLINTHTHAGMTLFRSLADDVDLMVFLEERVWPREVHLTPEDVYAGTRLAAVEMLKSGVTTFADMYFFEDAAAQAVTDTGIRALLTPSILQTPVWEPVLGTWEERLSVLSSFCKKWNGQLGRVRGGLGPHAPYTVSLEALKEIAAEARRIDAPVQIHLVETEFERDTFNARGLGGTIEVLHGLRFFDAKVIAAHSVWLQEGDLRTYAEHGVGVGHCPQSNAKLGAGIAPAAAMLASGINVGLGTDGAATNNNLDLWEEVRLAPLLAKVSTRDPKPLPARDALWMATRLGARAIHQPDLGVLAPGMAADIVTIRTDDSAFVPVFSSETYISHLVYSAHRPVDGVWVAGTQVVKDGELTNLDEADIRRELQHAATNLSERALAS